MANAGQTCIAAERVYVMEPVAERFKALLLEHADDLRPGSDHGASYGPATMKRQLEIIKSHIDDAIARGGKLLLGGPESVTDTYAHPVLLADVPEDSIAVSEETFGPTLVVNTVTTIEQAIDLSNASSYGLGASVWSKSRGHQIASQLRTGMVSINSVLAFAGIASVPFGGVGDSGYGRIHGPEGLKEFAFPVSIVEPRFAAPLKFTTFKRTKTTDKLITTLVQLLHGRTKGRKNRGSAKA
jgi:acyl-CoA reductase-like NAD-dependent aldehyde dehydrogenase